LPSQAAVAVIPLATFGLVIAWWGWKSGAYFRPVFLPGSILLLALTAALLLYAPWPARLRGPARIAALGLAAIAPWSLVSALWAPAPDIAVADATRAGAYALSFVLGIWICLLLGRRMLFALAPVAGAVAAVGVLTLIVLWTSDDAAQLLQEDATLRYPFGYRNAVAGFFLGGCFPVLALAASGELDWRLRGVLLGAATLAVELAILAQSRGAVFAIVVAVAIFVAVHPNRLRALGWFALATAPALAALPWLLDVFQAGGGDTSASLPPLRSACAAMAVTSVVAAGLGAAIARWDDRLSLSRLAARRVSMALFAAGAAALIAALIAISLTSGGPVGFAERNIDELTAGTPELGSQGSRYGLDVRTERGDLWGVAWDGFTESPVAGEGAGGFRFRYLLDRDSGIQPEDPHSVELLMASELGLPGLLMLLAFIGGSALAVLRARRLGPAAAVLAAGALGAAAYWLAHASVDWFWSYPALTVPVMFLLGAAAAPALLAPARPPNRRRRLALVAACAVAALAMLPFLISERYTNEALEGWRADLDDAYSKLEQAADLNPLSERPLVTEAVIAEEAGEPQRALAALSRAQDRQPQEWTLYYLEARVLAPIDIAGASRALARARELNPKGEEITQLGEEMNIP
jgi:hypothetical protein